MKKIKIFLLSLLIILFLGACLDTKDNQDLKLKEAIDSLTLPILDKPLENDFTLPGKIGYQNTVYNISYEADDSNLTITKNDADYLAKITRGNKTTSGSLKAYIKDNNKLYFKDFSYVIKAKDSPEVELKKALDTLVVNNCKTIVTSDFRLDNYVSYNNNKYEVSYKSTAEALNLVRSQDYTLAKITRSKINDISVSIIATISNSYSEAKRTFTLKILKLDEEISITEDGLYDDKDSVSLYIVTYHKLPSNYLDRNEFKQKKNSWTKENKYACFGGVHENREGHLPLNDNYFECDVDYGINGPKNGRGTKRLVYSLETLNVYYTQNHYASFTQLYDHGSKCY